MRAKRGIKMCPQNEGRINLLIFTTAILAVPNKGLLQVTNDNIVKIIRYQAKWDAQRSDSASQHATDSAESAPRMTLGATQPHQRRTKRARRQQGCQPDAQPSPQRHEQCRPIREIDAATLSVRPPTLRRHERPPRGFLP